ncbi:uncharacterized protein M6B38_415465 [Iris pallida]|uniref:Enhancer of polycomb-like protein n=1 Tax=Iris pallida TaxID=29817 RepID=A0AAX6FL87_IRIPA|nr:uncharacterized protein M6B38_415465 [Iris pallida]
MEVSVQRSASSDILRKARSLDLKSVYGDKPRDSSRSSSKSLKSGNASDFGRKRSRKEASLSGFGAVVKRQRNSLDDKKVDDCSSISDSLLNFGRDIGLASLKKRDDGTSSAKNSENSNGLSDDVVIPKRPRASFRQRKHQTPVDSEVVKEGSNCDDEVKNESQMLIVKRKKKSNRVKENGSHSTGEGHVRSRSKKASASIRQDHLENEAHLADDNEKIYGEEYDVGNLEENAARMLSSLRFDPRCIGFPGDAMASPSSPTSGYYEKFTSSRPESSSVDAAGRMLRPRRSSGKSLVRKRRHFYEVCLRDMDPYFLIKQRIRVFWPLDKSWYSGLVKDYDPMTGLHHVKYDDRDEEWIDLRRERFKLLLFPSEISGKFHAEISRLESTEKAKEGDQSASDGSCLGNFMDSEPIISWLTRSKQHRKLSSTSILKKRRKAHILKDFMSRVFLEQEHATVNQSTARLESVETLPEVLEVKSRTSSFETKVPFVYSRRRFHKRTYGSNKIKEHEYILGSLAGSVSIVALAADLAEELNISGTSVEPKQVIVKFSLRPMSSHDLAFGTKSFSLFHTLFSLRFGVLIHLWPMVHMEMVLVDNVMGLKLLVFEGSLMWVVGLLCSIITVLYRRNKQCKAAELRIPFTSIGCKLSGLHDQGAKLLFVLYSYLQLEILKWQYLEDRLKQQCLTMWELSVVDCTHSNIKNLLRKADQMLGASVYMNAVSIEGFPERLHSNIMHQIISDKPISLNMDPSSCFIDESTIIPAQSLSFATSPSFFMSLHLKLLIEDSAASFSIQKPASSSSQDCPNNNDNLTITGSSPAEDPSDRVSDITIETSGSLNQVVAVPGKSAVTQLKVETDALSFSNDADWRRSSDKVLGSDNDMVENSNGCSDLGLNESDETVARIERSPGHAESSQDVEKSCSSYPHGSSSPEKSEGEYDPCLNKTISQSQQFSTVEEQSIDEGKKAVHTASDMAWELNDYAVHCIKPTAPQCIWHRNRHSSISPTSSHWSNFWSDEFMQNGFVSGSKKPRTQVSYSFPFGGYDLGSRRRSHQRKARSYKNVNANRVSSGSASARSYHEPLNCGANVLVTNGDRGWRECGALVLLDSDDQKEWRICVKLSGATKFEYKVQHILQPGITNRHTHAMMWKGGKDWTLEFTDRSQWSIFKEMHEECYNRNIRASYVKNIPIPGVRLIADADDNDVEAPFVRCPSKYYRQVGTDVDMALDPSHVLYDMDSGDEGWISKMRSSLDKDRREMSELTDDMFERVMDTFEKFAYAQQCDEFSVDEIEEFMADVGELDIVKSIYEHWRQKRLEKGLPLVRQFQPPLWMVYEQQLKDWEFYNSRMPGSRYGFLDKTSSMKKPPIFAFCLRPRGLEIPNKGPKQRSHKKFMSAGCPRPLIREQDGFHTSGKRSSGFSAANKVMVAIPSYESSDSYHSNDGSEKCRYPKFYRNNSRKGGGMFPSPREPPNMPLACNKRLKRDGVDPWGAGVYELPSMQQQVQQDGLRRHRADIDEFRLRDASSAAKHALNMAKLKRERAQWLLHKADLALHKATTALIIADALKESEKDLIL